MLPAHLLPLTLAVSTTLPLRNHTKVGDTSPDSAEKLKYSKYLLHSGFPVPSRMRNTLRTRQVENLTAGAFSWGRQDY